VSRRHAAQCRCAPVNSDVRFHVDQQAFARAIQEAQVREQRRVASALIEAQVKVLAATFDKSAAYTNLIVLAAYAGFFGLWQLTKDYLSKEVALWSALLMLISVFVFVVFEIVKMIFFQYNFMERRKALKSPEVQQSPERFLKVWSELEAVYEQTMLHLMTFWNIAFFTAIATGMGATALLGYGFIAGLAR
jgi:hypothetical protein